MNSTILYVLATVLFLYCGVGLLLQIFYFTILAGDKENYSSEREGRAVQIMYSNIIIYLVAITLVLKASNSSLEEVLKTFWLPFGNFCILLGPLTYVNHLLLDVYSNKNKTLYFLRISLLVIVFCSLGLSLYNVFTQ